VDWEKTRNRNPKPETATAQPESHSGQRSILAGLKVVSTVSRNFNHLDDRVHGRNYITKCPTPAGFPLTGNIKIQDLTPKPRQMSLVKCLERRARLEPLERVLSSCCCCFAPFRFILHLFPSACCLSPLAYLTHLTLVRPGALSAPLSPFMRYAASANFFCSRFPINAWASALVNPTSGGRTAVQAGSLRK
jgi:hypothetical protein